MTSHITITAASGRYVVRAGGAVIGETDCALELREGGGAPVVYVPRADMGMTFLDKTEKQTTCPHKGVASYYSVSVPGSTLVNTVWSYESPKSEVSEIAGHLAFYTDRLTVQRA